MSSTAHLHGGIGESIKRKEDGRFLRGKRDGNPWGEALAMMDTPSGQRFYLNLHASDPDEDSEDKKLPGNSLVLGSTGSGWP